MVYGAGAIGSLYAARLSTCADVLLIGRAPHVQAIAADGLRISGREERTYRVPAQTALATIAPRTLVLLTTKVNANRAAVRSIAPLVRGDTTILCVQNGLGGEAIISDAIGNRARVLRAITQFGAIFTAPGHVDFKVAGYTLIEDSPVSGAIAALLTSAALDGRVSPAIAVEVWRKLVYNCVINPITSMIGGDVGSIADPRLDPLKQLVVDECLRVARAEGVTVDDADFVSTIARVFGASRNIASMRQDLLSGRATEIDFMNGAVVDAGRRHGIACPVNAALVAIVKALESTRRKSENTET